jgi:hypothetical protein
MRGKGRPYLHQEAEGPACLMLQDSKLYTSCKESKVLKSEGDSPHPPVYMGPHRQPPWVGSIVCCGSAEAGVGRDL